MHADDVFNLSGGAVIMALVLTLIYVLSRIPVTLL